MAIDIIARGMIESSKNDISHLFDITKGGEIVSNESSYTISNAVDYPLLGLSLYGKSTQNGTPTPEAPVDIISVGDNGFDILSQGDNDFVLISCRNNNSIITKQPDSAAVKVGESAVFQISATGDDIKYQWQYSTDSGRTWRNFANSTTTCRISNCKIDYNGYMYRCIVTDGSGNVEISNEVTLYIIDNNDCKIKIASITMSALPLCGVPVSEGGNYTDSNGQQWVCDELVYNADGSGKIIKRTKKTTITSDITPEYDGVSIKDSNVHIFDYSYSELGMTDYKFYNTHFITIEMNMGKMLTKFMARTDASVNSFKYLADGEFGTNTLNAGKAHDNYLEIGTSKASTVEEFKALINGCEIVYILATPKEIELSAAEMSALSQLHTYSGITNIFNSGGADMDVKFCTNKMLAECVVPITTGLQKQIDELHAAVLSLGGNI